MIQNKKHILKEAYKDILPPEIYKRGKAGFGVPLGKWFRGPSATSRRLSGRIGNAGERPDQRGSSSDAIRPGSVF